jgi:hypothetical protein
MPKSGYCILWLLYFQVRAFSGYAIFRFGKKPGLLHFPLCHLQSPHMNDMNWHKWNELTWMTRIVCRGLMLLGWYELSIKHFIFPKNCPVGQLLSSWFWSSCLLDKLLFGQVVVWSIWFWSTCLWSSCRWSSWRNTVIHCMFSFCGYGHQFLGVFLWNYILPCLYIL